MANNFLKESMLKVAQRETSLSRLMEGREKIKTEDIIKKYPNGVTLTEFDLVTIDDNTFPVFAFAENDKECFFGGHVLTKIATGWVKACDGDVETASDNLKSCGGIRVQFELSRTNKNNNITLVKVLG